MPHLLAAGARHRIKAILFDKDGTLLDFVYTWGRWSEHLLASCSGELGLSEEPLPAVMARLLGTRHAADGTVVGYERSGPLATGTADDIAAILAWQGYQAGLSWAEAKEAALRGRHAADEALEAERAVRLLPHVQPFLESCRAAGIKMAVVTTDETTAAEQHLEWLGIRHYFDACIGTDQAERGKPFPDMILLACWKLGTAPARTAVIGDTDSDMMMAKAAGAAVAIGITGEAAHRTVAIGMTAGEAAYGTAEIGMTAEGAYMTDSIGMTDKAAYEEALPHADARVGSMAELAIQVGTNEG